MDFPSLFNKSQIIFLILCISVLVIIFIDVANNASNHTIRRKIGITTQNYWQLSIYAIDNV